MPTDFVGENSCKEDTDASAGKEDEGGDLGHDLVAADQVPVLDDCVLELGGVVVPLVACHQLTVATVALDIIQADASTHKLYNFGMFLSLSISSLGGGELKKNWHIYDFLSIFGMKIILELAKL